MKKRIIKKYINRYIKPLIKDLPTTDRFCAEESRMVDGLEEVTIYSNNHTILNGIEKGEGDLCRSYYCQDVLRNIRLSALVAQQIISSHNHVYFRLFNISGNRVRFRLITE